MTIALKSTASLSGTESTSIDGGTAQALLNAISLVKSISNGTGLNAANAMHVDTFSIAASGTLNIDLTGGTLEDPLGNVVTFSKVKEVLLITSSGNTNDVIYGNGTNPFVGPLSAGTTTLTVKPGNVLHFSNYSAAGWTVGTDSADIIKLVNSSSGTAVTGTIAIVGLA